MSFFKEIATSLGLGKSGLANGYQIINYNGEALYAEGFKRILNIDASEVVLGLKTKRITVSGENLSLKELENNTVIICGKIVSCVAEEL